MDNRMVDRVLVSKTKYFGHVSYSKTLIVASNRHQLVGRISYVREGLVMGRQHVRNPLSSTPFDAL
jgi:hypothetical protein